MEVGGVLKGLVQVVVHLGRGILVEGIEVVVIQLLVLDGEQVVIVGGVVLEQQLKNGLKEGRD